MAGGGAAALRAPFPWFGSKARVARAVWERFGDPGHYIEPFCGSAAVLLGRPGWRPGALETVNDIDGLLVNAYRAVRSAPEEVAEWASWPLSETDMLARQRWLVRRRRDLVGRLEADPWHYDAQAAGWWLWGIACWVGADTWCLGRGTTVVTTDDEGLAVTRRVGKAVDGGAPRRPVHLTGPQGVKRAGADLVAWFRALAERLADVRILCGNWRRTLAPRNVHVDNVDRSPVAVFLDPPYSAPSRYARLYVHDDASLAEQARSWCLREAPSDWRVALCGLEGEHAELEDAGWEVMAWADDADGWGRNPNRAKETLWFSPACSGPAQARLFR
jgi:hypothetical protein